MAIVYADNIKWGIKNSDSVRNIQTALNKVSFPPYENLTVDGNYDWPTFNMVKAFQKFIGSPEDGYIDKAEATDLFRRAGITLDWQLTQPTKAFNTPFPGAYVGTPFGKKGSWLAGFHTGVDYPVGVNTPLRATWPGKVVSLNSWGSAYGLHVIYEHTINGIVYRTAYCHMNRIDVGVGKITVSGTHLGLSGNTGNTTGPHVHVEQRTYPFKYNDRVANPIL
jgi:murein DD-endopeptidase MepM/ murein hydrolase activator NlpD